MELYVEYVLEQLPLDQDWTDEEINDGRMECIEKRFGLGGFMEGVRFPDDVLIHWDER